MNRPETQKASLGGDEAGKVEAGQPRRKLWIAFRGRDPEIGFAALLLGFVEWCEAREGRYLPANRPHLVARELGTKPSRVARWARQLVRAGLLVRAEQEGGGPPVLQLGPAWAAWKARAGGTVPVPKTIARRRDLTLATKLTGGTIRAEQRAIEKSIAAQLGVPWIRTDEQRARSVGLSRRSILRGVHALVRTGFVGAAHITRRSRTGRWFCLRLAKLWHISRTGDPNERRTVQYCRSHQGSSRRPPTPGSNAIPPYRAPPSHAGAPQSGAAASAAALELIAHLARAKRLPPMSNVTPAQLALRLRSPLLARELTVNTYTAAHAQLLSIAGVSSPPYGARRMELAHRLDVAGVRPAWLFGELQKVAARGEQVRNVGAYVAQVCRTELIRLALIQWRSSKAATAATRPAT